MAHHPYTAEDSTHPTTHTGVQLQEPGAGGQAGAGEEDGHRRGGGDCIVTSIQGRGDGQVWRRRG